MKKLKADVRFLKDDVQSLRTDVDVLKGGMKTTKTDIRRLENGMRRVEAKMDRLHSYAESLNETFSTQFLAIKEEIAELRKQCLRGEKIIDCAIVKEKPWGRSMT